jgi:hypothetical protein
MSLHSESVLDELKRRYAESRDVEEIIEELEIDAEDLVDRYEEEFLRWLDTTDDPAFVDYRPSRSRDDR